jgi:hypothetical protein
MYPERMELAGLDRARYFLPTAICVYLATLCVVLIITSAFVASLQNAVAVTAAGVFGLLLTGGLGFAFWRAQRHDLRFLTVRTSADAQSNFGTVRAAALAAGWKIAREEPYSSLDAQTASTLLDIGERVAVRFHGSDVLVASICDPGVGFSLVGRQHCEAHRELVRRAVIGRSSD